MNRPFYALTRWDPDGTGPLPEQLVAAGLTDVAQGQVVNSIGRWDGQIWRPFMIGITSGAINALTKWDPDGAGPLPECVTAVGAFTKICGVNATRVAYWDGATWKPLGPGVGYNGTNLQKVTSFDPDGPGPQPRQLVVSGRILIPPGILGPPITRWDGTQWQPITPALTAGSTVAALTTWDPDGDGPLGERLIVGGSFATQGTPQVTNLASWDGTSWSAIGGGIIGSVSALSTWDPDGAGPSPAQLLVGGQFTKVGTTNAHWIASWDGSSWHTFGSGLDGGGTFGGPVGFASFDPDGDGPKGVRLVVIGNFTSAGGVAVLNLASWDGTSWSALGVGIDIPGRAVHAWDPDGPGPQHERIVAVGDFEHADAGFARYAAVWDDEKLRPLGTGLSLGSALVSMTQWDEDGGGPEEPSLVVAGPIQGAGGSGDPNLKLLARWDGDEWVSVGPPLDAQTLGFRSARQVFSWDFDGPGPAAAELVVCGVFDFAGVESAINIAAWDGTAWRSLGDGLGYPTSPNPGFWTGVNALAGWDPDGPGPQIPRLVAGGYFGRSGPTTGIDNIAWWDGLAWRPFGAGLGTWPDSAVGALISWDPDGPGPQTPSLVAAGSFTHSGAQAINRVARWDGSAWQPMGAGLNNTVYALGLWDPDGDGVADLIAGGRFTASGGVAAERIARWNGVSWEAIGGSFPGMRDGAGVYSIRSWDPDGGGPAAPVLLAGGDLTTTSGTFFSLMSWDGTAWTPISPAPGAVLAMEVMDLDGSGPGQPQLIVPGQLDFAGTYGDVNLCALSTAPPTLSGQPAPVTVDAGQTAAFGVTASGGRPFMYQWRRDGAPIDLASNPTAQSMTLVIEGAQAGHAGSYDCLVSNSCGTTTSDTAMLTVAGAACAADLNGDGVIDFSDYLEFLNLFDGLDPRADFNQDGFVDFADYLEFLNHFDAGC